MAAALSTIVIGFIALVLIASNHSGESGPSRTITREKLPYASHPPPSLVTDDKQLLDSRDGLDPRGGRG